MVDIFCKEKAIKAVWIPKLLGSKNKCNIIIHNYLVKQGLNFKLLLRINFRQENQFSALACIPEFYKSVFLAFNQCEYIKPPNKFSSIEILLQCIWGNEYFKVKGKTLLTEPLSITYVLRKFLEDKDVSACRYIQHTLLERLTFISKSKIYKITIDTINSKLFYTILLNKKFEKPYVEKIWEKSFSISFCNSDWQIIYMTNFKELMLKLSQFKYKILHNILLCGKLEAQWNKNIPPYCDFCKETEDMQHILYFCRRIKSIWMHLDLFIYLGFYIAFNTVQVISRWVVGRAEETSTYSSLGFCTVNCRPTASNYQLSHFRP